MPDWKQAKVDEYGFPLKKNVPLCKNEKIGYLMKEIRALQERMKSLENSIKLLIITDDE